MLDGVVGPLVKSGLLSTNLELDSQLARARRATGFEDVGDERVFEPLDILLRDLREHAHLNPLGRVAIPLYIQQLLRTRLRVVAAAACSNAETPVRPIFILGLPRTGTTFVHELLALHPECRAPLYWECASLVRGAPVDVVTRTIARLQLSLLHLLAPRFRSIHPMGVNRPHECVTIQAQSFLSMQFHAAHRVPDYHHWLADCDWAPAYAYHRQFLGLLGARQNVKGRWVLKAPGHLLGLSALLAAYPDAVLVQLHRDPAQSIPSMASLHVTLRRAFSDRVDAAEAGADVARQWLDGLRAAQGLRAADPATDARFLDLDYARVGSDPVALCEQICGFAQLRWDAGIAARMARGVQALRRRHVTGHRYSLDDFGLTAADVEL